MECLDEESGEWHIKAYVPEAGSMRLCRWDAETLRYVDAATGDPVCAASRPGTPPTCDLAANQGWNLLRALPAPAPRPQCSGDTEATEEIPTTEPTEVKIK